MRTGPTPEIRKIGWRISLFGYNVRGIQYELWSSHSRTGKDYERKILCPAMHRESCMAFFR
jgi:hypothetical protein